MAPNESPLEIDVNSILNTITEPPSDKHCERDRMLAMIQTFNYLEPSDGCQLSGKQQEVQYQLWQWLASRFDTDTALSEADQIVSLKVCCFMMDRLLLSTHIREAMQQPQFQHFLQKSLLSDDSLSHKYTVHILRKLFDNESTGWKTFFVINDTLNDKEIHLILPALDLLRQLDTLPCGWRWILISKALQTSNHAIIMKVIRFTIALTESSTGDLQMDAGMLFRPIFVRALNATALYNVEDSECLQAEELRTFMYATCNGNFANWLRLVVDTNWLVVPVYHISEAVGEELCKAANRDYLLTFLGRVYAQPNVFVRNQIMAKLKNLYVSAAFTSENERESLGVGTDDMFIGQHVADSYKAQAMLCKYALELQCFDAHTSSPAFLQRNECLNEVHKELCLIASQQWATRYGLPEAWQFSSRESLCRDATAWSQVVLQGHIDTDLEALRVLEAEFLSRSPFYSGRKLMLIALGLLRMLPCAENAQDFVVRLCEDHPRLAMLVALLHENALSNAEQVLDAFWQAIAVDKTSSHSLATFLTLLDYLSSERNLNQTIDHKYYQWIIDFLPERPKWLYTISRHIRRSKEFGNFMIHMEDSMFQTLIYGCKIIGDQIAEYNLLRNVCGLHFPDECNDTSFIRMTSIKNMFFDPANLNELRLLRLKAKCIAEISTIYRTKPRHYANSLSHRQLLRLLQVLALLARNDRAWMPEYGDLLLQHNHQPGVLQLLELLVAYTCPTEQLQQLLREAITPNARRSVIVCMFHARNRPLSAVRAFVDDLLPWTMGKDFATRLLAQFVVYRLLQQHRLPDYQMVVQMCLRSLVSPDHRDEHDRLSLRDFRFGIDPDDLLGDLLVLHDVPRLTGICSTEWIPLESIGENLTGKSLTNKFTLVEGKVENRLMRTTPVELNVDNVQRKIVPLRQLFPEWQQLEQEDETTVKVQERSGLVVVASLLSKEANLGGLARTCEIFGAQELVLANLKTIETREFQALSMTAEKWLVSTEVKPFHLLPYLLSMRQQGYKIIGAEQTANGISIGELKFPQKSVLLLGNEKQGIPADLLSVLDVAVEVPQFGVVRSLNVHVTGALFVWEYAKQHNIPN